MCTRGIEKWHELSGKWWHGNVFVQTSDSGMSSFNRSCVSVHPITRLPEALDLWYHHSYSSSEVRIQNVEKHLMLNKGYPLDRKALPLHSSAQVPYLLIGASTNTLKLTVCSHAHNKNEQDVCSHDGLFSPWCVKLNKMTCCLSWSEAVSLHVNNTMLNIWLITDDVREMLFISHNSSKTGVFIQWRLKTWSGCCV